MLRRSAVLEDAKGRVGQYPDDLEQTSDAGIGRDKAEPTAISQLVSSGEENREAAAINVRHLVEIYQDDMIAFKDGVLQHLLNGAAITVIDVTLGYDEGGLAEVGQCCIHDIRAWSS
jgi:hypothetical protein